MSFLTTKEFKDSIKTKALKNIGVRKDFIVPVEAAEDRCLTFTISTDDLDSSNDKIFQDGWDLSKFVLNPVVLFAHDSSSLPVGKCTAIGVVDGKLKATVEFVPADMPVVGPLAEACYRMCLTRFMSATSVGYLPIEYEWTAADDRDGGIDFFKQELREFSIVPVPANAFALIDDDFQEPAELTPPVQMEAPTLNTTDNSRTWWKHKLLMHQLNNKKHFMGRYT